MGMAFSGLHFPTPEQTRAFPERRVEVFTTMTRDIGTPLRACVRIEVHSEAGCAGEVSLFIESRVQLELLRESLADLAVDWAHAAAESQQ